MAKKKGEKRIQVIMEAVEGDAPGRFRYYTTRNRINTTTRLELKKYCPYSNPVVLFRETK
jgi:large subunit ribosomal protein L33